MTDKFNIPQMGNFIENMAREFACVADRMVAERDAQAQRIEELEAQIAAARKALEIAWAAMCERRGYADAWEWKYGMTWDEEDAEVRAALNRDGQVSADISKSEPST